MAHYAHYLRREAKEVSRKAAMDPWFAESQPDDQGFAAPSYHITRSATGPAARVRAGDTIWVFAQLFTPWGPLPPALDAKITVQNVVKQSKTETQNTDCFRYEAGEGSVWFPLRDATACILQLQSKDQDGKVKSLLSRPEQPIGQALQSMRELADGEPIQRWAAETLAQPLEFVSYRLIDGTRPAFQRTLQLVNEGSTVFWDRWSLPRRLAERREFLNDDAFNAHLLRVIGQCAVVWSIDSPKYAEPGSYSAREKNEAERLGIFR